METRAVKTGEAISRRVSYVKSKLSNIERELVEQTERHR